MPAPVIRSYALKQPALGGTSVTVTASTDFTVVSGPGATPVSGDTLVAFVMANDVAFTGCGASVGTPTASAGWTLAGGSGSSADQLLGWGQWSRTASGTSADNLTLTGADPNDSWSVFIVSVYNVSATAFGTWHTFTNLASPQTLSQTVPTADLVVPFFGAFTGTAAVFPSLTTPSGYSLIAGGHDGVSGQASGFSEFSASSGSISSTATATANLWAAWNYAAFTGTVTPPSIIQGVFVPRDPYTLYR